MMAAFGEGIALANASGLDCAQLLKVLDLGAMANPMFKLKGPKMLESDYAPNFPLKHSEKDMRLAVALGGKLGLELPVASTADSVMKKAMDRGQADNDFSAVLEAQQKSFKK